MLHSCPETLIAFWREAYGEEMLPTLLQGINDPPPAYVRVNTLATDTDTFLKQLQAANVSFDVEDDLPDCLRVADVAALKAMGEEVQLLYYPQDKASQYAIHALGARPGERVADVCAAPGGKTFTVAQYMQNRGEIVASDLYAAKCDVLRTRAAQLGASIVQVTCRDASAPPPEEWCGKFDRVICDAPCSGYGVIRRKPEIRYKDTALCAQLPPLQRRILAEAAKLVKVGGVLQYSTCTLNPAENRAVAEWFLEMHPQFSPRPLSGMPASVLSEPDWCRTFIPAVHETDGFFIAAFTRTSTPE